MMLSTCRCSFVNNIGEKFFINNVRRYNMDSETVKINCKKNFGHCSSVQLLNDANVKNTRFVGFRHFSQDAIPIIRRYVHDGPDKEEEVNESISKDYLVMFLEDFRRKGPTPFAVMPDIDSTYDEFNLEEDNEDNCECNDEDDIDDAKP